MMVFSRMNRSGPIISFNVHLHEQANKRLCIFAIIENPAAQAPRYHHQI